MKPAKAILASQCIDHSIALVGATTLLFVGLRSAGLEPLAALQRSGPLLASALMAALFVSSLFYRSMCLGFFGHTLGNGVSGLMLRKGATVGTLLRGQLWESLGLAVPLFWFLEGGLRLGGVEIGLPYVFCYNRGPNETSTDMGTGSGPSA